MLKYFNEKCCKAVCVKVVVLMFMCSVADIFGNLHPTIHVMLAAAKICCVD